VFSGPFETAEVLLIYTYCTNIIAGAYTLESRIHKLAVELLNIIEELVVQLCTLFLLQICLTDGKTFS